MHPRASIRSQVVTILQAHPDLANLFVSRGRPAHESQAPFGKVLIGSETSVRAMDYHSEKRTLDLRIQLVVQASAGTDDALDDLAETVENLMAADPTLNSLAERHDYQGTTFDFEGGANADLAAAELRYSVEYIYEPAQDLDDLIMVATGIDMASPRNDPQLPVGADGQIDASATVDDLNI